MQILHNQTNDNVRKIIKLTDQLSDLNNADMSLLSEGKELISKVNLTKFNIFGSSKININSVDGEDTVSQIKNLTEVCIIFNNQDTNVIEFVDFINQKKLNLLSLVINLYSDSNLGIKTKIASTTITNEEMESVHFFLERNEYKMVMKFHRTLISQNNQVVQLITHQR